MQEAVPTSPPTHVRSDVGSRALAIGIATVATIIGLLVLAWAILFVTKGRFLKHRFERIASQATGREVKVAGDFNFYFDPIATKFLAEGLTVSNPKWATKPYFWQSKLIDTRIATLSLIFGDKKLINWIGLQDATADLEWDAKHQRNTWTFGDPKAPAQRFELPLIQRAEVSGTNVHYSDAQMQIVADVAFPHDQGHQ